MDAPPFDDTLDALLEAGRSVCEPMRERLERDRGEAWKLTVSARHGRGSARAFGHVELAGRPVPPDDREQWAILEITESEDPTRVHVSASLDAWDDAADSAAHWSPVAEQHISIADARAAIAVLVPTLEAALDDLLTTYRTGWHWLADLRAVPEENRDAVIADFARRSAAAAQAVGETLIYSSLPAEHRLGAVILGFVGEQEPTKRTDIYNHVLSRVSGESDPGALAAILIAAGRLGDPRALGAVQRFADHPDPDVRAAVVFALARLPHGDDTGS